MPSLSRALVATAFLLSLAGQASAHAHLKTASPEVDGTVASAPKEVTATFTEKLEEKLSRLTVKNGDGRQVDKGDTHFPAGSDGRSLAVTLESLPAGTYTVNWTAASVDTHKTTGSFTFVVRP